MKIKQNLFFLLFGFMVLGIVEVSAQIQITGSLADKSKMPIAYANVVAQNLGDATILRGTSSDSLGQFALSLSKPGEYVLTAKYLGYETWFDTLNLSNNIDLGQIQLRSSTQSLETVVVTAEREVIEIREDQIVFNVQSSPLKEGYDGLELLERTPNVWVNSNGSLQIRNEKAIVMVNGRPLNLSGADLSDYLQSLSSEDVKKVEVQTSISANLDGEQSGGVINIFLKKPALGWRMNTRANYTFKSEKDYRGNASLRLNYGSEHWNIYGNYNRLQNTSLTNSTSEIFYFETDEYLKTLQRNSDSLIRQTYRLGFVWSLDDSQSIGGEFFGKNARFDFYNDNQLSFSNPSEILDKGATLFSGEVFTDAYSGTLNYAKTFKSISAELKVFADRTFQESARGNRAQSNYLNGFFPDTLERNDIDATTLVDAIQMDWIQQLPKSGKLEAGVKLTNTQRSNALLSEYFIQEDWVANERTTRFDYDERIVGAYSSWSKTFATHYFFKAGLRWEGTGLTRNDLLLDDRIKQAYHNWLPSIYFSKKLGKGSSLSWSYARRIRRPSFALLNNNIRKINDFRYEIGNPNLAPEYINNFELKLTQKQQSMAFYYTLTTDAINGVFFLEDAVSYYQKINLGAQKQWGLYYNRFGKIKPWWQIKGSAFLYYRKFTNPAGEDSFAMISYRLNLSNVFKIGKTTQLDFGGYYISPRSDAFYVADNLYTIRLMVQKSFLKKRLLCRIYLDDAFNNLRYMNVREFDTFKTTSDRKPQTRTINFWMSYTFKTKHKVSTKSVQSKNDARKRID